MKIILIVLFSISMAACSTFNLDKTTQTQAVTTTTLAETPEATELVDSFIETNQEQIEACYEAELLDNFDIHGNVTMEWQVLPTGKVIAVKTLDNRTTSTTLPICLEGVIQAWEAEKNKWTDDKANTLKHDFTFPL